MAEMRDHDRINELQAYVAGLIRAMQAMINALEVVQRANPTVAEQLAGPLREARAAMTAGEREADRAEAVGEDRLARKPLEAARDGRIF